MMQKLITLILQVFFNPAARRALQSASRPQEGCLSAGEVRQIIDLTWRSYHILLPDLPREPTFGARVLMLAACAARSLYGVLVEQGFQQDQAIDIISEIYWSMLRVSVALPGFAARVILRDPLKRLRITIGAANRFIFSRPAFQREDLPDDSRVSFDYFRCPLADYFKGCNLGQLCEGAFCAQDFAIASLWNSSLHRSGTLAGGQERCDFRWAAE